MRVASASNETENGARGKRCDIDGKPGRVFSREEKHHKLRREGERVARSENVLIISSVDRKASRRQLHRLVRCWAWLCSGHLPDKHHISNGH